MGVLIMHCVHFVGCKNGELFVMKNDTCKLNIPFIRSRLKVLELKQWWIAERIGVDRKTVSRWLLGKVGSAQYENILALARVLECKPDQLILKDRGTIYATMEDQKRAAEALCNSNISDILGPIGEWDIIEKLLKATIIPNLPAHILGKLYLKLCIASWRQSKIDEAIGNENC